MVQRRTTTNVWRVTRQRWARKALPCAICGQDIDYDDRSRGPLSFELDHRVEIADGGTDHDDNLQPVHSACHREKTAQNVRRRGGKWGKSVPQVKDPRNNRHMRDWGVAVDDDGTVRPTRPPL